MEIINKGSSQVSAIICPSELDKNDSFRTSLYCILTEHNGSFMAKNTFTQEIVKLSEKQFRALQKLGQQSCDYDFLCENELTELAKKRFIVEQELCEADNYLDTAVVLRLMQKKKNGLATFTILPTTGCNARCTYCYEQGYKVSHMTDEIADKVVEYICSTCCDEEITLSWFGGEPLLGRDKMTRICEGLAKRGVAFRSKIITNASLFDRELVAHAKKVWNLISAQVSMDGIEKEYTRRKQYLDPKAHNYEKVLQAIDELAQQGIRVSLRVNYDKVNLETMQQFIDELEQRFANYDNVHIYFYMLFQQQHTSECVDVYKKQFEFYERNKDKKLLHLGYAKKFKLNFCMADNLDESIVIDPEGKLFSCEHMPGEHSTWGNVFDGVTSSEKLEKLKALAQPDEKCRQCPFLPQCTPFYMHNCPDWFEYCREYNTMKTEFELKYAAEKNK